MTTANELVDEWLTKAHDDELNARSILLHRDGTAGAVCFLSQQMSEKLLKSFLVFHRIRFPKIHDLTFLLNLATKEEPGIKKFLLVLKVLNRYYIETRYPGDYPEFSWSDAEEALAAAEKVKDFVLAREKSR